MTKTLHNINSFVRTSKPSFNEYAEGFSECIENLKLLFAGVLKKSYPENF